MVEFYPRFERDHDAIMGSDYLDLVLFWREPFATILTEAGFREIVEHVGETPDGRDLVNEGAPPEFRQPWDDAMWNWTAPETAVEMWRVLRIAVGTEPGRFDEWPGMVGEIGDVPDAADRIFARAVARGARWHIAMPGL